MCESWDRTCKSLHEARNQGILVIRSCPNDECNRATQNDIIRVSGFLPALHPRERDYYHVEIKHRTIVSHAVSTPVTRGKAGSVKCRVSCSPKLGLRSWLRSGIALELRLVSETSLHG